MFKSKYSMFLSVILIILIIAIIIIAGILGVNAYKNLQDEEEREKIYATIQGEVGNKIENNNVNNTVDESILTKPIDTNIIVNNSGNTGSSNNNSSNKTTFYKDYPTIGYITIDKTNIKYPILLDVSPKALEISVGVMYPSNPKLNQPGNTVIIGHNYRNGKLFSNNKKLVIGDKIKITDLTGKTLTYTIYEISTIPETDTEYITRERGDNIEISLSTCTDDGKARLVILARV